MKALKGWLLAVGTLAVLYWVVFGPTVAWHDRSTHQEALVAKESEPVTVYTTPPGEIATLERERSNLEAVLHDYPRHKAQWEPRAAGIITYTVRQRQGGLVVPNPCAELPIRVTINRGQLVSATYAASGGRCKKGRPVKRGAQHPEGEYLTPTDLFRRIADSIDQLKCYRSDREPWCLGTSLWVHYQPESGLPIKLEDYSELVSDTYWSLEVSDIRLAP